MIRHSSCSYRQHQHDSVMRPSARRLLRVCTPTAEIETSPVKKSGCGMIARV